MIVRIKFTKTGSLKFIGHLDIMRYFQKAFRRADVDVEYSQGFSPHQLISFAAPLGVGLTSDGEYMDAQLRTCEAPEIMMQKLNKVMADEIQVVNFTILPDESKNAMSIVSAADYLVSLKDSYPFMDKTAFEQKFQEFYNSDAIVINKKTKKSESEVDIKPFIYQIAFDREEFDNKINKPNTERDIKTVAESYENGIKVYMQLATGSVNNLKPELVMEAFCQFAQIEYNPYAFQVHRMEVYANQGDESDRKLIPLDSI